MTSDLGLEVSGQPIEQLELLLLFGPWLEARGPANLLPPLVDDVEISQRKLEIDHRHVAARVQLAVDVLNVGIAERADHHGQRVEIADR